MGYTIASESPIGLFGGVMKKPEDVRQMLALHDLGWGSRRIARELGTTRHTVRKYLKQGGWLPYQKVGRAKRLDGLMEWLKQRFFIHRGNAEVVRQELLELHGIRISLRTIERAVKPFRDELKAQARATVRFETKPGKQLQIDFGTTQVLIGDEKVRVHLFVATLGYSRRGYVKAFAHERQLAWLDGIEGAFAHFEGIPEEILFDNARALVTKPDPNTSEVVFNERFSAFASYWGFRPIACAPYRARTKGKDENGVGYVKRNAIAGRRFTSWAALEAHLEKWIREISDERIHGTTGERPKDRFLSKEALALKPLKGRPPFVQVRELSRKVHSDSCVEIDRNHYSVPWQFIGQKIVAQVSNGRVTLFKAGEEVAVHRQSMGSREWIMDREHRAGIVDISRARVEEIPSSELARPLAEYEAVMGGGF